MNTTKVTKRKPNHERSAVMFEALRKGVREASEAAKAHSNGEILSLDMRRADSFMIGIADAWDNLRRNDLGRAVSASPSGVAR